MSEEKISLAGGCFWCVEAVYLQIPGVLGVQSGYMGGHTENPSYKDICTGTTGHAEIIEITYDPELLTLKEIFDVFWRSHDPTTLNRQGNDQGTQYRSAIFTYNEEQKVAALASREEAQAFFEDPIVTEISDAAHFYPAEEYHHNYYQQNKSQPYCQMIISPKLKKLGLTP